ncbi:MAG: hypothetical protein AAF458_10610 [Pseudomonadota bacterium]
MLSGLWLMFWWPELSGSELLFARDLGLLVEPAKAWGTGVWSTGAAPVWAPWLGTGLPYLADPANQAFYPPNVLYLLAPTPAHATTWFAAGHVLLGTIGVAALARYLHAPALACIGGGATYGLSGYVLSITDNMTYLPAVAWVPLGLACWVSYLNQGAPQARLLRWAGFAVCVSLMVLAGDPLHPPALVGVAVLLLLACAGPYRWLAAGGWLAGAVALGLALGAVQLLPALHLAALSDRSGALPFLEATAWSLPPARLPELFHPWWFGSAYPAFEFRGTAAYAGLATPWASSIHVGAVPITLLAAALAAKPQGAGGAPGDRRIDGAVWVFLLIALMALVFATGRYLPAAQWWYSFVGDVVRQRYPEKLVFLATLAFSVLTALAIARLQAAAEQARRTPRWRRVLPWTIGGCVLLMSGDWLVTDVPDAAASPLWSALIGIPIPFEAGLRLHARVVTLLLLLLAAIALVRWRWLAAVAVGMLVIDGFWVHARFPPAGPGALLSAPHTEMLAPTLRAKSAAVRVLFDARDPAGTIPFRSDAIAARVGAALAAHAGRGEAAALEAGYLPLYAAVFQRARLHPQRGVAAGIAYLNAESSPVAPTALLDWIDALLDEPSLTALQLAGVTHVFALPAALARWQALGLISIPVPAELHVAVLTVPEPKPLVWWRTCADCRAVPGEWRADGLSIDIDAPTGATLLTRISALDGWQATLNGRPLTAGRHVPTGRWPLLAFDVPVGAHRLELRYQAPGSAAGSIVTAGALAVLSMVLFMAMTGRARARA